MPIYEVWAGKKSDNDRGNINDIAWQYASIGSFTTRAIAAKMSGMLLLDESNIAIRIIEKPDPVVHLYFACPYKTDGVLSSDPEKTTCEFCKQQLKDGDK